MMSLGRRSPTAASYARIRLMTRTLSAVGLVVVVALILGSSVTPARLGAQALAIEPIHFHHVHLNSTDPAAAAAYYPKPFALSATKTAFNGFEAVKTGNIYILFTKVAQTPQNELTGPQTAVWHFGWNTPNSRQYNCLLYTSDAADD